MNQKQIQRPGRFIPLPTLDDSKKVDHDKLMKVVEALNRHNIVSNKKEAK